MWLFLAIPLLLIAPVWVIVTLVIISLLWRILDAANAH